MSRHQMLTLVGISALIISLGGGFIIGAVTDSGSVGVEIKIFLGVLLSVGLVVALFCIGLGTKLDEMEDLITARAAMITVYGAWAVAGVLYALEMAHVPIQPLSGMVWFILIAFLYGFGTFVMGRKYR